jgi:hypothetical protein
MLILLEGKFRVATTRTSGLATAQRTGTVQLTMTADVREQVNINLIKRATFVDGH